MFLDDLAGAIVAALHQLLDLLIDLDRGVFAIVAMLRDFAAEEDLLFLLAVAQCAEFAHAPFADHLARDVGSALDVVAGAGGHLVHEDFLGDAAAHEDGELIFEIILARAVFVFDAATAWSRPRPCRAE